ncbi:polysaccharide deacetylase family protein [Petropleomorpha daqingensis]|uniref:Peptidoglycan/xylan/chitin deacetylase (PgdA/CDA1 family) n=1 Tax=Petropleomorpha daqingensis TaxID=2026353 RepID=A0A853CIX3_9ACTN|nr:polysaccharide deacetylase family protein [Petropleomorpha daqingensis]NYJ06859.1 peptidoglycan/xylan/chitin deacetylase (PgdA/CDA1 family) [Petropleomorpha daqingensis]
MDRRRFLLLLAAGLAGAAVAHGAEQLPMAEAAASRPARQQPPAPAAAQQPAGPAPVVPVPADPPVGVVSSLPGEGTALALTIDDGVSDEVVGAYAQLALDTGIRLTFFPNGCYRSWTDRAAVLRPLVDSGQVALGNHTWSHRDLTTLADADVAGEIARNRDFLQDTFGAGGTPFFRPPYGAHDERVDRIAAEQGHPTVVMWNGTLGDDRLLSGEELLGFARQWFAAQAIVIGHANHPPVTTVYGQLLDLMAERGLHTVTLADVWARPADRLGGLSGSAVAPVR